MVKKRVFEGGDDDDKVAKIVVLFIPKVVGLFLSRMNMSSVFEIPTPSDPAHECTPMSRIAGTLAVHKMTSSKLI